MTKPVMIMLGGFTNRIYAVRRYTERSNGLFVAAAKDDVTQQALSAAIQHVAARCANLDCECQYLMLRRQCGVIYPVPVPGEPVKACSLAPRHDGPHSDGEIEW